MIRLAVIGLALGVVTGLATYSTTIDDQRATWRTTAHNTRSDVNTLCEVVSDQETILNAMTDGKLRMSWVRDVREICK